MARAQHEIDARIEQKISRIVATLEALSESFLAQKEDLRTALAQRDREIKSLRNEIEIRIKLDRKLARAQREVAEMQARAPDFRAELANLKSTIERQQKTIVRLRGQASQLEFAQRQLDAEQSKNRREVTLTVTKLSAVGAQTRTALEALRENGFDLWEMEPPSGSTIMTSECDWVAELIAAGVIAPAGFDDANGILPIACSNFRLARKARGLERCLINM